ncbi:MAG TPA: hypothetical protein VMV94_06685 [Phycisphaerae bacterium]|nr:hypothetical protein [Phycisphaerae bacterium]
MNASGQEERTENAQPQALPYAPRRPGRRWWRRLRIPLFIVAGFAVFMLILNHGLDFGYLGEVCTNCGAHSHVQQLSWYGIGGEYARRTQEGPVSKWVQACEGRSCVHKWEPVSGEAGGLLGGRARFQCRGLGPDLGVRRLEFYSPGCLEQVLQDRLNADPQLLNKFKKYVLGGEGDSSNFYGDLENSLLTCSIEAE